MATLLYKVILPPIVEPPKVAGRTLHVGIDAAPPVPIDLPPDAADPVIEVPEGSAVDLTLTHFNVIGVSLPSACKFIAEAVVPQMPGVVSVEYQGLKPDPEPLTPVAEPPIA